MSFRAGKFSTPAAASASRSVFLKEKGFAAVGLDYQDTLINRLKGVYPETRRIYGTIEDIPDTEAKYDGLVSWGVIEHNEEGPQRALAEFHRVLKPGGYAR